MSTQSITDMTQNSNEYLPLELIRGTGEELHDTSASGRERPWGRHKMANEKIAALYEKAREQEKVIMSDSRMESLKTCADKVVFNIASDGRRKLAVANFCRVRLCPMCNWRRSMKLFSQVSAITDTIMERQDGTRFIFLTLTVRNVAGADLEQELERLNKGFSYLTAKSRTFAHHLQQEKEHLSPAYTRHIGGSPLILLHGKLHTA